MAIHCNITCAPPSPLPLGVPGCFNCAVEAAGPSAPAVTSITPSTAPAGTFTVTAHGTGFTDLSEVYLNSSPMPTTYVSDTQLTASVTAIAGAHTISVHDPITGVSGNQPLTVT